MSIGYQIGKWSNNMDNIIFRLSNVVKPTWLTGMGVEVLETYIDGSMTIESTNRYESVEE